MSSTHQPDDFSNTDDHGKVRIYDIPAKRWKSVARVDAREMVNAGTASMNGPDVEMVGPAGKIMVCGVEVDRKIGQGYEVVGQVAVEKPTSLKKAAAGADEDSEASKDDPYDFSHHTVAELREFAKAAEIDISGLNKHQVIAKLTDAGFDPR